MKIINIYKGKSIREQERERERLDANKSFIKGTEVLFQI